MLGWHILKVSDASIADIHKVEIKLYSQLSALSGRGFLVPWDTLTGNTQTLQTLQRGLIGASITPLAPAPALIQSIRAQRVIITTRSPVNYKPNGSLYNDCSDPNVLNILFPPQAF